MDLAYFAPLFVDVPDVRIVFLIITSTIYLFKNARLGRHYELVPKVEENEIDENKTTITVRPGGLDCRGGLGGISLWVSAVGDAGRSGEFSSALTPVEAMIATARRQFSSDGRCWELG